MRILRNIGGWFKQKYAEFKSQKYKTVCALIVGALFVSCATFPGEGLATGVSLFALLYVLSDIHWSYGYEQMIEGQRELIKELINELPAKQ